MIRQIPLRHIAREDYVPQAIISRPIEELASKAGIKLFQDYDDLDEFVGAGFEVDGAKVAMLHYTGHPKDTTTIYFPYDVGSIETITRLIALIVAELELPEKAIKWQRAENPGL
jgi:hypothetical protein